MSHWPRDGISVQTSENRSAFEAVGYEPLVAESAGPRVDLEAGRLDKPGAVHLEQLATYGDPDRDPRMRTVTVAYLALAPDLPVPRPGGDAAAVEWLAVERLLKAKSSLGFDHGDILGDGVERARAKLEYTPLAASFCPSEFTVADLRRVYEIVWDTRLDPRNFHRKVTGTPQFLVSLHRRRTEIGRPAELYRVGRARQLHPPMLRPTGNAVVRRRRP